MNYVNNNNNRRRKKAPPLTEQAKNFVNTAKDIAKDPRVCSQEEYDDRIKICHGCTWYNKNQHRCMKCGCMLKGKARFKAGKCPLNKW